VVKSLSISRRDDRTIEYTSTLCIKPDGKRRVKKCYLGPLVYEYVSRLHTDLNIVFKGLLEPQRAIEYLEAILQSLLNNDTGPETRREIARKLRFYADILEKT